MYKKIFKGLLISTAILPWSSVTAQDSNVRIAWNNRTYQELKSYTVTDDKGTIVKMPITHVSND